MSRLALVYEQTRPLIIWLGLTELIGMVSWLWSAPGTSTGFRIIAMAWTLSVVGWTALVVHLGKSEFYLRQTRWMSNLVGFVFVIALTVAFFGSTETGRLGVTQAARHTSHVQLAGFHVLRLLAIGTLIKYFQENYRGISSSGARSPISCSQLARSR